MALLLFGFALHAQSYLPASLMNPTHQAMFGRNYHFNDSTSQKKWFVTRHTALSTSYTFFRGGHASMVAVPMGLQLNRRLNPNLYAFANATIAPAYINFSRSFAGADLTKGMANHPFSRSGKLAMYSSASLGLMYVNDEKTFSISGSLSVERNNYPLLPYYPPNRPNTSRAATNR